jgi:ribonuclease E
LWHKIFGSPTDQSAKLDEIVKTANDALQSAVPDAPGAEVAVPSDFDVDRTHEHVPAPDDDLDADENADVSEDAAAVADDATLPERKHRPRRRRRRRGGRGDRAEEADAGQRRRRGAASVRSDKEEADSADELASDDDESDSDGPADDDLIESEVDANGDSTTGASRGRTALQRSIPSWDEAIGFIVESNMQSRSQRRQTSQSGSRGHSSRNHPRGRHKK